MVEGVSSRSGLPEPEVEDVHTTALSQLCRVCGTKFRPKRTTYLCTSRAEDINLAFGIDVTEDNPHIHPEKLCKSCSLSIDTYKKKASDGITYNTAITQVEWGAHTENCTTCARHDMTSKGGRPKKATKKRGRPSLQTTFAARVAAMTTTRKRAEMPLSPSRFVSVVGIKRLVCTICNNVVDEAVELGCHHIFCKGCLSGHLKTLGCCPTCDAPIEDVSPVSPVVQDIINDLQLHCDNAALGCSAIISLSELAEHVRSCHPPYQHVPAVPASSTPPRSTSTLPHTLTPKKLSAIMERPTNTPLSTDERKAVTHLVKCAIGDSSKKVLELPTGGQVCTLFSYNTLINYNSRGYTCIILA